MTVVLVLFSDTRQTSSYVLDPGLIHTYYIVFVYILWLYGEIISYFNVDC